MKFEWDANKSNACFENRGFDFAYVIKAFFDPNRIVEVDKRWDYGEPRFTLYGCIDARLFIVVYTVRRKNFRIISARKARKANKREVKYYENRIHGN